MLGLDEARAEKTGADGVRLYGNLHATPRSRGVPYMKAYNLLRDQDEGGRVMEPIRYVERLGRFYKSQGFPPYDWTVNEIAPLTPLREPLDQCRGSMLTAGGISCCEAPPWNPQARNDLRLDEIAADSPSDDFQIHDDYYDHRDADLDLNCQFPIDRLRELAAEGVVGEVASRFWSGFMGRIYKRGAVIGEAAPALAKELEKDGVDLFILVPA